MFIPHLCQIIAYIILIPGLTINLYSYSFFGTDITKSTLTTITLLWNDGYIVPAVLLAFFALAVGETLMRVALRWSMGCRYLP